MIGRLLVTALFVLLALGAVLTDPMSIGYQTGLLLLLFAALAWFQWESNVPIIRLGAKTLGGLASLMRGSPSRRSPSGSG
jgi:uncharacterized membrane-anchored protein YitT (DUF2179 family)